MAADPSVQDNGDDSEDVLTVVLTRLEALIGAAADAKRKVVAEALLELTLGIDDQEARSLVEEHLPEPGLVTSSSLTLVLLEASGRRSLERRARWLDALDPSVVSQLKDAKGKLEGALVVAWPKAVELVEQSKRGEVETFASSVARLTRDLDWPPASQLAAAVGESGTITAPNEAVVAGWLARCDCALIFESVGLLSPADWRESFVAGIRELAAATPADPQAQEKAVRILIDRAPELVEGVEGAELDALDAALAASPWLAVAERHLARVRVAAARRRLGQDPLLPVGSAVLIEALDAAADGADQATLEEAVGLWIGFLHSSDDEVWAVAQRYVDTSLPEPVRIGLERFAGSLSPTQRSALAARSVADFPDRAPTEAFLEAIGFHTSDPAKSVELIVQAFPKATNEDAHRAVLRLWGSLRLTERNANTRLLDAIMTPLVSHGKTSRELALQHLHLVQGLPSAERRRLARSFEEHASGDEWSQIQRRLLSAGFMVEKGPPLFRRIEHLRD